MPETPKQQIRIDDELWEQFKERAQERGYSGAAAVRAFCERYAAGDLDDLWWLVGLSPAAAAGTVGGASGGGGEASS